MGAGRVSSRRLNSNTRNHTFSTICTSSLGSGVCSRSHELREGAAEFGGRGGRAGAGIAVAAAGDGGPVAPLRRVRLQHVPVTADARACTLALPSHSHIIVT
eukprot:1419131-Rhodomonas_salina.1